MLEDFQERLARRQGIWIGQAAGDRLLSTILSLAAAKFIWAEPVLIRQQVRSSIQ